MAAFRLSPSHIARYFYHECERYLRYHTTPSQVRTAQGIPRPERAKSLVTQALLDRGYAWEEEADLDTQPDNALVRLICHPTRFAEPLTESRTVRDKLKELSKTGFTFSQRQAFRHLVSQRLTLVWGPPGTGKTYFLARALLCLAEAYWQADSVLRVGVTAFTHAAIENLLLAIAGRWSARPAGFRLCLPPGQG